MSANVPAEQAKPKPNVPMIAGGNVAALIPQSLEEAFRVANAIAASSLAPRGLDRPEQILVAIMAGAELGLAPFQSLQSFAVVNGRPTLWGDGLMAVARSGGVRVKETVTGEGDAMTATCEVTRPEGEVITRSFSVTDAKKAGLWGKQGPWQQYPRRMLGMRARAWALRDGCADMLRGFQVREEVEDYEVARTVPPRAGTGMRARLEARAAEANGGFDPDHIEGELTGAVDADFSDAYVDQRPDDERVDAAPPPADEPTAEEPPPQGAFDVLAWADDLERKLPLHENVDLLRSDWNGHKQELHARDPERFKDLNGKIAKRAAEIAVAD